MRKLIHRLIAGTTAIILAVLSVAASSAQVPATSQAVQPPTTNHAANVAPSSTTQPAASSESFYDFYAKNLRQSLFAGFLTLGSFLVAVNTFIIVNLKKELYDHPSYRAKVRDNRELERKNRGQSSKNSKSEEPLASFYGPLRHLSGLLLWTIFAALVTAISQLTLGVFWRTDCSAGFCLGFAGATIILLFVVLIVIRLNLRDWFAHWEDEACKEECDLMNKKSNDQPKV